MQICCVYSAVDQRSLSTLPQKRDENEYFLGYVLISYMAKGIAVGTGWACYCNARGRMRTRNPIPWPFGRDKSGCIMTAKPDRSVLITIIR